MLVWPLALAIPTQMLKSERSRKCNRVRTSDGEGRPNVPDTRLEMEVAIARISFPLSVVLVCVSLKMSIEMFCAIASNSRADPKYDPQIYFCFPKLATETRTYRNPTQTAKE